MQKKEALKPKEKSKGDVVKQNLKTLLQSENPTEQNLDVDGVMQEVFRGPASIGQVYPAMEPGTSPEDYSDVDAIAAEFSKAPSFKKDQSFERLPQFSKVTEFKRGGGPANIKQDASGYYYDKAVPSVDGGSVVSASNPYRVDQDVFTPLKQTPMEKAAMEEALRRAMGGAARDFNSRRR